VLKITLKAILIIFVSLIVVLRIIAFYYAPNNKIEYSNKYLRDINGDFITMTDQQQSFIKNNIIKLKKGMSIDEVHKLFGEPTYIQRLNTKEGKDIGWVMAYYFIIDNCISNGIYYWHSTHGDAHAPFRKPSPVGKAPFESGRET
jgi:hypothetical protein